MTTTSQPLTSVEFSACGQPLTPAGRFFAIVSGACWAPFDHNVWEWVLTGRIRIPLDELGRLPAEELEWLSSEIEQGAMEWSA